jgi:hypothetical protein
VQTRRACRLFGAAGWYVGPEMADYSAIARSRLAREQLRLTICYLTARSDPRIDWAVEGIRRQRQIGDVIELLIVDVFGRGVRELVSNTKGVDSVVVVSPKPNLWQGPYRVTARDLWAKSQSANTALCLAKHDYVAFLDDRCVLGKRWLATVRTAARRRKAVLAGAYERLLDDGQKLPDHRLELYPEGQKDCGGGWLYGCTFALPLDWALDVNGFEEGMDGMHQEDCVFGHNLKNAGYRIDFKPSLFVTLSRKAGTNHVCAREEGAKFQAARERFFKRDRTEFTSDLRELRARVQQGEAFPLPDPRTVDWYNRRPLREIAG